MAWWSETIMGGDGPLDALYVIAKSIGVKSCYEDSSLDCDSEDNLHGYALTHEGLVNGLPSLLVRLRTVKYEPDQYWQVLGAVALHTGVKLPEDVLARVIEACESDPMWHDDNGYYSEVRAKYMADFVKALKEQKEGEVVRVAHEGLFERINKRFA